MGKSLVIVESPAKAKTINKYLGSGFTVKASMGHVRDLPQKNLGVDVENDFQPQYITSRGKNKVIKELREAAEKADTIYLAPDPDREGEAIAWHIAHVLKKNPNQVRRVMFNQVTKQAVLDAIQQPTEIDMNRVNAQQARRVLDRLVGYMVSPVLWKAIYRGNLSAGRVQSVALRLICEREEEIKAFVPEEYWSLTALLRKSDNQTFSAKLHKIDGRKAEVKSKEQMDKILTDLDGASAYRVGSVDKKTRQKRPQPPFITSTLQQDAANRLRLSNSRTMQTAQQLYEGLEIGQDGPVGLITYMRTDSVRVAPEAQASTREFVVRKYGDAYIPAKPNFYKSKKGAQDAHEAIRPTDVANTPAAIKKYLSNDQYKLYELIWKRFVASQMSPARFDATTVDIDTGAYTFRATGSVLKFDGFLAVYESYRVENGTDDEEEDDSDRLLPPLAENEAVQCDQLTPKQHFTKPPPRFTQATLVKELEADGIGRPSTYATIIGTLVDRTYVELENRAFVPTDKGMTVNKFLVQQFPDLFNVAFTAQMEDKLDRVEAGSIDWVRMIHEFYVPFRSQLDKIEKNTAVIKQALQEETDEVCPECGEKLVIKLGKHGRFLACKGFPACKYTRPLKEEEAAKTVDLKCDKCGAPMMIKEGRYGRFLACTAYPKCQNIQPIPTGVKCPEKDCDGELIEKQSRKGKTFFSCNRYPKCQHASWNRPIPYPCPHCGHYYIEEKKSRSGKTEYACPACKSKVKYVE